MYAILDIETTGGKFNQEGITEIAIYIFDGKKTVDSLTTLVNPERNIQPFVEKLTGISQKMVKDAPKFYEIAKRIEELTRGCVLVAHNTSFDYRILKNAYKNLGYNFLRDTLCTVELSKKAFPNASSHSLGKLVRSLGIPIENRHRAYGDALATLELFKIILNKKESNELINECIKKFNDSKILPRLQPLLEDAPPYTGIYYMCNTHNQIIYIGKSKNIQKRIKQHFTGTSRKALQLQREIETIRYQLTGNELIALLLENQEIKNYRPKYNKALKQQVFSCGLYPITDTNGYIQLKILKINTKKKAITTFKSISNGKKFLEKVTKNHQLCAKMIGLSTEKNQCFNKEINECLGACIGQESSENYNKRVRKLIEEHSFQNKNMLLIGKGKSPQEYSVVLIKNSEVKGFTYFKNSEQISTISIERLEERLIELQHNQDAKHIIQSYLRKYPKIKKISF